jgi:hypothetical protein
MVEILLARSSGITQFLTDAFLTAAEHRMGKTQILRFHKFCVFDPVVPG